MSAISRVSHLREQQIYLSLLNSPSRGPSTTWLSRNSSSRASEFPLLHWTTAWLLYSGNYATNWNGENIIENPPENHYGMVLQKFEFIFRNRNDQRKK
jgi:hypothetical protein